MSEEKGLSRQAMCNLLAAEFQDGWIVNLGVGIPTVCSNADFGDRVITLHSENGGIGGAMDLAACAKRVFIVMEHATRDGAPRIVETCALPITAPGVVKKVATNFGLFSISPAGVTMDVIAPGLSVDEVEAATGCALHVAENLHVAEG